MEVKLAEALAAFKAGRASEAEALYREIARRRPGEIEALRMIGVLCGLAERHEEALAQFDRALRVNRKQPGLLFNRGISLLALGRNAEALDSFDRALKIGGPHADSYASRAAALRRLQRQDEAIQSCDLALRLNPFSVDAQVNKANALADLKRHPEALAAYDEGLRLKPNAEAWMGRGEVLRRLRRFEEALAAYDEGLRLKPNLEAWMGRGEVLRQLRRFEEALAAYDAGLRLRTNPEALMGRGEVLRQLGRFEEALASFVRAHEIEPSLPYLPGEILYLKMRLADWDSFDEDCRRALVGIDKGLRVAPPGPLLSIASTMEQQRLAAEIFARDKYPAATDWSASTPSAKTPKITIGYFSPDFRSHAVAYLTAGLFEHHDRREFHVVGFAYGGHVADDYTRRIAAGVDRFIDVSAKSDDEIAALSRSLDVDIAVDLAGLTIDERLGIFAQRAAPVQVSYLGYPGTTGCRFIDFIIADDIVIPVPDSQFFTEKTIRVPVSYQINDSRRSPVGARPDRAEEGLPERGFVFCCFNNGFKLTPDAFAIWMRLLQRVEGSVLWLLASNATFAGNLRKYARAHGVAPERLIFAKRVPHDAHLARQQCADLALDTFYYNGHTTTSDALWAGLPVVTRKGATFAARVAASLLQAIDLPDLITHSAEEYEELAFRLAKDSDRLAAIKRRLEHNRITQPLFDTAQVTKHLEAAYRSMLGRGAKA